MTARRRSHLRSRGAAQHAVRADKEPRAADILALHRLRSGLVKARTAEANRLRGLLGEYGIVIGQGLSQVRKRLPEILEDGENGLSGLARELFADGYRQIVALDHHIKTYEAKIQALYQASAVCRKLGKMPGIGPITATAAVATLGDGQAFETARQVSAWLGLVPAQDSSGGKPKLLP